MQSDQTAPLGATCVDPDQTAPLGAACSVSTLFAQAYLPENSIVRSMKSNKWANYRVGCTH